MAENNTENKKPIKPKKKQGPIRWGAIIFAIIFMGLVYLYAFFFFDNHLRKAMEWGGYMAYGGEINIDNVTTSFWNANFTIDHIQVTDLEKPEQNAIEIGQIRGDVLWDALLRAKVVITEAAVEGIQIQSPRKRPGKVRPPSADEGPGFITRESQKVKAMAIAKAQENYNNNILGDFASVLSGGVSVNEQLENIKGQLKGVVKTEELSKILGEKQEDWKERIKNLPTTKDLQALEARLKNVKTSGFKNPMELQASLKEVDQVFKELEEKRSYVDNAQKLLNGDVNTFGKEIALIESYIKQDIEDLEDRLKIPKLDAENISKSLFMQYLGPMLAKVDEYKELAYRYMPPNLKAGAKKDPDSIVQAHPRADGTTYTFGTPNSYPLFWLQSGLISSKAENSPFGGDVRGEIKDLTTNQHILRRPTTLNFQGNFPKQNIAGVLGDFAIDLREGPAATFQLGVDSYPVGMKKLSESEDVKLAFANALGAMNLKGSYKLKEGFSLALANTFSAVEWKVEAAQSEVQDILSRVVNGLPNVTLNAKAQGEFPGLALNVNSNLGPELVAGFSRVLSAKLNEAKAKIEQEIRGRIEAEKGKLEAQYNQIKSQFESEIKKVETQIAGLKKQADGEKKKAQNQAKAEVEKEKKKAEAKAKKAVEKEGKKALDDLKKGLGF